MKTKNTENTTDKLAGIAQQAGVVLMTAAFTLGMLELPESAKRVIVPHQPIPEFAESQNGGNGFNLGDNSLRREREETGPHYVSYNVAQRTPGRTGRA